MSSHDKQATLNDHADCDEFDELLEQSSLGTRTAKENQTRTSAEAYRRLENHLRGGELDHCDDVDDFLLHMVRWYAAERDAGGAQVDWVYVAVEAQLGTCKRSFRWSSIHPDRAPDLMSSWAVLSSLAVVFVEFASDAVPRIVRSLHNRDVFSYLRSDVARDMMDICFKSQEPLPPEIIAACASAVSASKVRDEPSSFFFRVLEPPALPSGSWCRRPALMSGDLSPGDRTELFPNVPVTPTRTASKEGRQPLRVLRRFSPRRLSYARGESRGISVRCRIGIGGGTSNIRKVAIVMMGTLVLAPVTAAVVIALRQLW